MGRTVPLHLHSTVASYTQKPPQALASFRRLGCHLQFDYCPCLLFTTPVISLDMPANQESERCSMLFRTLRSYAPVQRGFHNLPQGTGHTLRTPISASSPHPPSSGMPL